MHRLVRFLGVLIILALMVIVVRSYRERFLFPVTRLSMPSSEYVLNNAEFKEQLVYMIARKLNLYEGDIDIVDIVNLETAAVTGEDYVLITVRVPDGTLCQVTARRQSYGQADWQLDETSFKVVGAAEQQGLDTDTYKLLHQLGMALSPESFEVMLNQTTTIDETLQETGPYRSINTRWLNIESPSLPMSLSVNKDKKIGFTNQMSAGQGPASIWQIDYPSDYLGPGYRQYLYDKTKGRK